jgi:hypothetical protein
MCARPEPDPDPHSPADNCEADKDIDYLEGVVMLLDNTASDDSTSIDRETLLSNGTVRRRLAGIRTTDHEIVAAVTKNLVVEGGARQDVRT